ncbi:MAG TPA: inositol monophosphatase family protein, partial [Thermoanaerobaculia bacterium]|nr:inositol monophosphatase family protein [Thermoanaerobaculia bacterium]
MATLARPPVTSQVLERLAAALRQAGALAAELARRPLAVDEKTPGDPVTEADRAADRLLRELLAALPLGDEGDAGGEPAGWLSEETADDGARLGRRRAWVVDPLDGTREYVAGIPEWCVSVGLVEDGRPVAGGVYNPAADHLVLGAEGLGVTFDGAPAAPTGRGGLAGATVLASRSEVDRGEWEGVAERCGCRVVATGSVAWKLALV